MALNTATMSRTKFMMTWSSNLLKHLHFLVLLNSNCQALGKEHHLLAIAPETRISSSTYEIRIIKGSRTSVFIISRVSIMISQTKMKNKNWLILVSFTFKKVSKGVWVSFWHCNRGIESTCRTVQFLIQMETKITGFLIMLLVKFLQSHRVF